MNTAEVICSSIIEDDENTLCQVNAEASIPGKFLLEALSLEEIDQGWGFSVLLIMIGSYFVLAAFSAYFFHKAKR